MNHILVVEDDVKTARLIELYLQQSGYKVTVAYDGHQALALNEQNTYDLIILDLMLHEMDGLEICRALRMDSTDLPIIILTAKSTEDDVLRGLDIGADDYITKPFSPREVVARVRTVLRRAIQKEEAVFKELRFG